jgi:hypothetical protein
MIIIAAALMLAGSDADLRHNFVSCLKNAATQAQRQKITVDGFVDFARTTCANAEEPFKATLVNANVQHGMSRKESASDASQQVNDYYSEWKGKYSDDAPAAAPAKAAAPTPVPAPATVPTPASAPTDPK